MDYKSTLLALSVLVFTSNQAFSDTIYYENFNNTGFLGSARGSNDISQKYPDTTYNSINDFNGWTFTGQLASYALSGGGTDGAVLLNEPSGTASVSLANLSKGTAYSLLFEYWGDNAKGGDWGLHVLINGIESAYYKHTATEALGTGVSYQAAIPFSTSTGSVSISFVGSALSTASPIIDNVSVSSIAVPGPIAGAGLPALLGFGALFAARRRRTSPVV